MSSKTRDNYSPGLCLKPCKHKDTATCDKCIRFDLFSARDESNKTANLRKGGNHAI